MFRESEISKSTIYIYIDIANIENIKILLAFPDHHF